MQCKTALAFFHLAFQHFRRERPHLAGSTTCDEKERQFCCFLLSQRNTFRAAIRLGSMNQTNHHQEDVQAVLLLAKAPSAGQIAIQLTRNYQALHTAQKNRCPRFQSSAAPTNSATAPLSHPPHQLTNLLLCAAAVGRCCWCWCWGGCCCVGQQLLQLIHQGVNRHCLLSLGRHVLHLHQQHAARKRE